MQFLPWIKIYLVCHCSREQHCLPSSWTKFDNFFHLIFKVLIKHPTETHMNNAPSQYTYMKDDNWAYDLAGSSVTQSVYLSVCVSICLWVCLLVIRSQSTFSLSFSYEVWQSNSPPVHKPTKQLVNQSSVP